VPVPGSRVLVGRSQATDALDLPGEPLKPQEYLIRYLPDTLVLLGCETGGAKPVPPRRAEGKFGRALGFDGRRDVTVIEKPGFRDEAGTLEAWGWLPAEKQPECHGTILRLDGVIPWTYHILQRDMNTSRISYTTYDGKAGHGLASGDLAEGWHHVAGTYDAAAGKMELFIENSSECNESYLMDQVEFYVTLKMADQPELDGNQLIDEFFTRYYGAAAGPMKDQYLAIEETFSNPKNYPIEIQCSDAHQHQTKELAWGSLGTKQRMARFGQLMAQAKAAARTPQEKERVALFEQGQWEYMRKGQP